MRVLVKSSHSGKYWGDIGCGVVTRDKAFSYNRDVVMKRFGTIFDGHPIQVELEEVSEEEGFPHCTSDYPLEIRCIIQIKSTGEWVGDWNTTNTDKAKAKSYRASLVKTHFSDDLVKLEYQDIRDYDQAEDPTTAWIFESCQPQVGA